MTDDQDPTGMSHLLAGLKETGPMPDDLNDRIRASLEGEQATRATDPEDPEGEEAADRSAFWAEMDQDGRGPSRRSSTAGRWVMGIAAAAVVVMGVGGIFAIRGGDETADSAGATTAQQQSEGEAAAPEAKSSAAPSSLPAFAITNTDTDYSRSTLGSEAAQLLQDPEGGKELSDSTILGSMSTAAGAKDCLGRLGRPDLQPVVLDVARFEGTPGVLVIAEPVPDGAAQAWALTTGCEEIWPGPTEVTQD